MAHLKSSQPFLDLFHGQNTEDRVFGGNENWKEYSPPRKINMEPHNKIHPIERNIICQTTIFGFKMLMFQGVTLRTMVFVPQLLIYEEWRWNEDVHPP